MDGLQTRWDQRSAEQWLDESVRFERMASRFGHLPQLNASFAALARDARMRATRSYVSSDLDYFRMRAAMEQTAAANAHDVRVQRVHLEMAERYQASIQAVEAGSRSSLRLVS